MSIWGDNMLLNKFIALRHERLVKLHTASNWIVSTPAVGTLEMLAVWVKLYKPTLLPLSPQT